MVFDILNFWCFISAINSIFLFCSRLTNTKNVNQTNIWNNFLFSFLVFLVVCFYKRLCGPRCGDGLHHFSSFSFSVFSRFLWCLPKTKINYKRKCVWVCCLIFTDELWLTKRARKSESVKTICVCFERQSKLNVCVSVDRHQIKHRPPAKTIKTETANNLASIKIDCIIVRWTEYSACKHTLMNLRIIQSTASCYYL